MQRRKQTAAVLLFLGLFCAKLAIGQQPYTVQTLPNPKDQGTSYVSNPDNILAAAEVNAINQLCRTLEQSSSAQVAVVIVNSIGRENPKDFATTLFATWGIGQAGADNGLLIFSVLDQRRTEFETGYGMEAVLPDIYCYRIGMQELVPYFKEAQYGQGLLATLVAIQDILNHPETIADWQEDIKSFSGERSIFEHPLFYYALLALLFNIIILTLIFRILQSKDELYDKYMSLRKLSLGIFILLFPIAYLFIYIFLQGKLKRLRNQERHSKLTGLPMRKLKEDEEDDYLEKGQITEELIRAVDYDVWISESADDILILRYAKRFSKYSACPKCGYQTYHLARSMTVRRATRVNTGLREHTHECKNCHYRKTRQEVIPRIVATSSGGGGGRSRSGGGGSWSGGRSGGGGGGVSW